MIGSKNLLPTDIDQQTDTSARFGGFRDEMRHQ
jgi:hypothetical protein